jgi:hypothetical protein
MGYEPRTNLINDENGDLLAESRNVLNRWKNYFSRLLYKGLMTLEREREKCILPSH